MSARFICVTKISIWYIIDNCHLIVDKIFLYLLFEFDISSGHVQSSYQTLVDM